MTPLRCACWLGVMLAVVSAASLSNEDGVNVEITGDKQADGALDEDNNIEGNENEEELSAGVKAAGPVNERFPHAILFGGTCGGSIISPNWVLTAGHCAMSNFGYEVLAGTNNSWDDTGVYRDGKRIIIHPLFMVGPHFLNVERHNIKQIAARWDFLLVELEKPFTLDGKTIAAATLNEEEDLPPGLEVGYAGYGAEEQGGFMRHEMHGMDLEIISNEECAAALVEFDPKDMVCARGRAPRYDSACNGDSGSGLVDASGRLVGVASWVEGDAVECRNGAIVVFSRVSAAREWIRDVTGL